jgi:hypothetical protein
MFASIGADTSARLCRVEIGFAASTEIISRAFVPSLVQEQNRAGIDSELVDTGLSAAST